MKKCKECGGRGYFLAEDGTIIVCDCQKKKIYSKLYDYVGIDNDMIQVDVDQKNYNIETLRGKKLTYQQTINYIIWNWKEEKKINIYIQGPTGTGKTLFANKLSKEFLKIIEEKNLNIKNTAYLADFTELLNKYKMGWENPELAKEVEIIKNKEILIIDEFLKRKKNGSRADKLLDYDISFLNDLLSQRMKKKITILISNESIEETMMSIDDQKGRIASRLGSYEVFNFGKGKNYKDYRTKEKEVTADNFDFSKI